MGIIGTNYEEKFLLTKDKNYHKKGSNIFKITRKTITSMIDEPI